MKRIALALLLVLVSTSALAQFPATVVIAWDPLPATGDIFSDAVNYDVTFNSQTFTVTAASCTSTECKQQITIPSAGSYTVTVTGRNALGFLGTPASLTFTASTPGRSGNLRLRIP